MAMVDLAINGNHGPVTLAHIAGRQDIALNYLEQIFMKLRKNGLVNSVRGPGGGYVMPQGSMDIKISEIVMAVDESIKMTRCSDRSDAGCRASGEKCLTHDLWEGLGQQIFNYLNSITLGDICREKHTGLLADHEIRGEKHASV